MYWSQWDSSILFTGILTIVLACIPFKAFEPKHRWRIAAAGAGISVLAVITGNIQSLTYPSIVEALPLFPIGIGIILAIGQHRMSQQEQIAPPPSGDKEPSDTLTPEMLAELAYRKQKLRDAIRENPATPPGVLEWLGFRRRDPS